MIQRLRNWKTIILALALLASAETVARVPVVQRLFDPGGGGVYAARWRYEYAPATPDVLIMGDSRAVMDLSPGAVRESVRKQTNDDILVVNAAVHGSSMEQSYLMLSEVVLRQDSPGLIILNVSEVALNDAAWINNPPLYLRGLAHPFARDTWRQSSSRTAVMESLSALLRLQHRLRLTIEERWPNYLRGSESYDWGGSLGHGAMPEDMLNEQFATSRDEYLKGFAPDQEQGQYLRKLLEYAHTADIPLVLVITPVTDRYLNALPHPADATRFREYVCAVAAEYGIPLFDYYRTPELTEEHFFDLHHTNAVGTTVFSQMIARDIVIPALADWEQFLTEQLSDQSVCGGNIQ